MTDQTIPADKVRAWVTAWETTRPEHRTLKDAEGIIQALRDLLPPPPRPTLADMTLEERRACQWMQVDTPPRFRAVILATDLSGGRAALLDRWGDTIYMDHEDVTPRPDLPRLEWSGTETPDPAPTLPDGWRLADHEDYGRGIVTNPTPNRNGRVYFVLPADEPMGYDLLFCDPADLTFFDTDQEADQ